MDKAEREFLSLERQNIQRTLELLNEAYARSEPSKLEWIAIATLLQNLYTGMENILRFVLRNRGVKVPHSASWHKDLLSAAVGSGIVTRDVADSLMQLLLFRHVHVHGYSFSLDPARIQPLVEIARGLVTPFFAEIDRLGFISAEDVQKPDP